MSDGRAWRAKRLEELVSIEPGTLGELALKYLQDLEVRNYSPHTIRTARLHVRLFLTWFESRGLTLPEDLSPSVVRSYQRHLYRYRTEQGRRLSARSQLDRLGGVRRFGHWLCDQGHTEENPAAKLRLPRYPRRLPRGILTAGEVEKVLAQPDTATDRGLRDRAILEVLYSTGIRRGELKHLALGDLDLSGGSLTIREGKGRKDRIVPLSERAAAWVRRYLEHVRPQHAITYDPDEVFISCFGRSLSGCWIGNLVRTYIRQARIGKEGSCHLLRHTCATLMLEGGADIRYIQRLLGHATLQSTEIYTHVAIAKLKEVHRRTHPGAKLARHSRDLDSDSDS